MRISDWSSDVCSSDLFRHLVLLDALLKRHSVSAAARELDLPQPTASHGLARLRKALGDPLLVRRATAWSRHHVPRRSPGLFSNCWNCVATWLKAGRHSHLTVSSANSSLPDRKSPILSF